MSAIVIDSLPRSNTRTLGNERTVEGSKDAARWMREESPPICTSRWHRHCLLYTSLPLSREHRTRARARNAAAAFSHPRL